MPMKKGYYTSSGYVGFLPDGREMLFASEGDYNDFVECDE